MRNREAMPGRLPITLGVAILALVAGCSDQSQTPLAPDDVLESRAAAGNQFRLINLPPGFQIEKLADGLSFATEMAFDDQGRLYVNEAGGGFEPTEFRAPRILRIDPATGNRTVVIDLSAQVVPPVVRLAWDNGWLYFTHRDLDDTGALSRVRDDGIGVQKLLTGSQSQS